jgi:hypothetical protein
MTGTEMTRERRRIARRIRQTVALRRLAKAAAAPSTADDPSALDDV